MKENKVTKVLFAILVILLVHSCKTTQDSNLWTEELTKTLENTQAEGLINGFGVAIVNQQGVLYQKGFGYADLEEKLPYTHHTVQNIASISKTFLGIGLLKAQELGHLLLDDPIQDYLSFPVSNPHFPNEQITIRHLATHTSSIYDTDNYDKSYVLKEHRDLQQEAGFEYFQDPDSSVALDVFLERYLSPNGVWYLPEGFMNHPPGSRYEYSNIGATLAAYVLEMAVGQPYDEFIEERVLGPLSMKNSGWSFETIDFTKHTKLYANSSQEIPYYRLITYPDGGMLTSIHDLSLYLIELIKGYQGTGTLLSQESYQELFTPQLSAIHFEERDTDRNFDDEYNSGIFIGHTPNGHIGHTGGDPGVSTYMFFDPETQIGRMLFINTDLDQRSARKFFGIWNALGEAILAL